MTARELFVAGAAVLAAAFSGSAEAQPATEQYVQVAHIEIDPVQLEEYRAAVREQITAAIRDEPGVLVLYAVSDKDNPARVTVFEIIVMRPRTRRTSPLVISRNTRRQPKKW